MTFLEALSLIVVLALAIAGVGFIIFAGLTLARRRW